MPGVDDGAVWSAIGQPLKGFGGGRYYANQMYLVLERGVLSSNRQQIRLVDVFDVDATQTMTQKARQVGTLSMFARRAGGAEQVLIEDIGDFRNGVAVLNELVDQARYRSHLAASTRHVNYQGPPIGTAPAAASTRSLSQGTNDLNAEIARLAEFHRQGILSADEFTAAKRRLLGI